MDPFSLSLISLGVSGMAVRRIAAAMRDATEIARDGGPEALLTCARKLLIHAVAETSVRRVRGAEADAATTMAELSRLPDYAALVVDRNVPLDLLFELEVEEAADEAETGIVSMLSRRSMDAVIYDRTGLPIAALCQPRRRTDPPPLVRQMFEMTDLPLICVPAQVDWQEGLKRVNGAFAQHRRAA